jgi:outer membrane protein assembly factor BamB
MMVFTAGVLICGAQNSPGPHGTFALDGATGRELWRRELWSHPTTEVGALTIADGAIFALASASVYGSGTGSELYALQL